MLCCYAYHFAGCLWIEIDAVPLHPGQQWWEAVTSSLCILCLCGFSSHYLFLVSHKKTLTNFPNKQNQNTTPNQHSTYKFVQKIGFSSTAKRRNPSSSTLYSIGFSLLLPPIWERSALSGLSSNHRQIVQEASEHLCNLPLVPYHAWFMADSITSLSRR